MLRVKRVSPDAQLPVRANPTDAGMDLASVEALVIPPGGRALVDTGLQVGIPFGGYYLRIAPRSGLAVKHGIHVGAGVVDEGYLGNVKVLLFNLGTEDFAVTVGMRIAQAILEKVSLGEVLEVNDIAPVSRRGAGGFGSSDAN